MIVDVNAYKNLVRIVADRSELTVEFSTKQEQPSTDPVKKIIRVAQPLPTWSKERTLSWMGEIFHEAGHHAPEVREMMEWSIKEEIDMSSFFGNVLNLVEDYRQEKNRLGYWLGRDEALSHCQGWYATKGIEKIIEEKVLEEVEPGSKTDTWLKLFAWYYNCRAEWQPDVLVPAITWRDCVDYSKYEKYTDELNSLVTHEDVVALTRKLIDEEHNSEEEEEEAKRGSEEGGSDSEGEGDSEESEGEHPKEEVSYKDLLMHDHSKDSSVSYNESTRIKYDHDPFYDYIPIEHHTIYNKKQIELWEMRRTEDDSSKEQMDTGRNLANTVRKVLKTRSLSHMIGGKKRGKLNSRALHSLKRGNKHVFKKPTDAISLDVSVTLLVDCSGSMGGRKLVTAAAAAGLLNDAIARIGVDLEIIGFTEDFDGCVDFVFKPFGKKETGDKVRELVCKTRNRLQMNADGDSILFAFNRLKARTNKNKLLIVLSDGQPSAYNRGDCWTFTKQVIEHIENKIDVFGIGIMDTSVEQLYKHNAVLEDASMLEKVLLDLVQSKIINK